MTSSLVGSEMCIRDSPIAVATRMVREVRNSRSSMPPMPPFRTPQSCLLYTSDAADDMPTICSV
eukprot:12447040-Prorocentrum_lima.AAC.1